MAVAGGLSRSVRDPYGLVDEQRGPFSQASRCSREVALPQLPPSDRLSKQRGVLGRSREEEHTGRLAVETVEDVCPRAALASRAALATRAALASRARNSRAPQSRQLEIGPLELQDLDERIPSVPSRVVYRDPRRLIQREQIRVVVDEFERCRGNVWLFALDSVLEAVSRSEDGLRVDGSPIEPQPPTTHRLVQVRLGALRGKLVAHHIQHASAEPAALGEGGEGVLVRHHVTAAVENRVQA